jgi:hypothetical protein
MFHYLFAWSVQFLSVTLILMIGAVPTSASVFMLVRNQRNNITASTYRQLLAATASIIVALAAFSLAFFETKVFSSQSLGNVMYLFAMQVVVLAWVAGYLLGLVIDKTISKPKQVANWVKYVLKALIFIFTIGVARHVAPSVDVELARNSESKGALTYLAWRESSSARGDDGIAARLAFYWRTPSSALAHLSKHPNNSIRLSVARNENTSMETLVVLSADCNERVRLQVLKRRLEKTVSTPSKNCLDDNEPITDTPYR